MRNLFLIVFLFLINISFSQQVNLGEIKKNVTNASSPYFYEKLVKEFQDQPTNLKSDSLKSIHLYYGKLYSGYYKKVSEERATSLKFIKLTGAKKYAKAIKLGKELWEKDPVNLVVLLNLIVCYQEDPQNEEKYKKLKTQSEVLLSAIACYGDGKTKETSFKVISTGDEFALLGYFGVNLGMYTGHSEKLNASAILNTWTKEEKYKIDHRNKIYITVYSNNAKP